MKRLNPSSKQGADKGKRVKMSSKQQNTQLGPFVFENLPDGVRDQIYELVAADVTAKLLEYPTRFTSSSALMLSNHQISHEFATMLDGSAEIKVTIINFDFPRFLNFLNTRTKNSFRRITSAILKIKLEVDMCPVNCDAEDPDLLRWAEFLRQQKSEGTDVLADYSAVGDEDDMGEWITALDTCVQSQCSEEESHCSEEESHCSEEESQCSEEESQCSEEVRRHFAAMIDALQDPNCE